MKRARHAVLAACLAFIAFALPVPAPATELDDARALVREGDYPGALAKLDAYLGRAPGDPQARFLKGVVLAEQERVDEAIELFSELTVDYPALPEPHNNLAVLYASRGDYDRARDALLLAISTHPSYATAHENLGDIYAKMAGLAYDKALQLDGENATARAKLELLHDLLSERTAVASVSGTDPVRTREPAARPATRPAAPAAPETSASAPARPPAPAARSRRTDILATLTNWAQAWSSQDVERYLEFYAPEFRPADGRPRSGWVRLRRLRLTKPQFIEVVLSDMRLVNEGDARARVTFSQSYRSESYEDLVRKQVDLVLSGTEWKIVSEVSLP